MSVEIEIKLRVPDLDGVREKLREIGARPVVRSLEINTLFDTPRRDLLTAGSGLRLRLSRDIDTGAQAATLTYKGPRAEGPIKRREEIEIHVDDARGAMEFLARLNYSAKLSFEKRRDSWQLDQVAIELDTLPELGDFVEIEGPTEAGVLAMRDRLDLGHLEAIPAGYPELVARHLKADHTGQTRLTFPP